MTRTFSEFLSLLLLPPNQHHNFINRKVCTLPSVSTQQGIDKSKFINILVQINLAEWGVRLVYVNFCLRWNLHCLNFKPISITVLYQDSSYHGFDFNYLSSLVFSSSCGPRRKKTSLRRFANKQGADQTALPCSLISAFVICLLESIIIRLATSEIQIFC